METKTLFILFSFLHGARSFYFEGLPGIDSSVTYCTHSKNKNCNSSLMIYTNRLNTLKNVVPYEYHSFDFCVPSEDVANSPTENLGQVVFGDRIRPSEYILEFNKPIKCKTVCEKTYTPGDKTHTDKLTFLKRGVSLNYQHHWIVDNMPINWCYIVKSGNRHCTNSFPMGCHVTKSGHRKDTCITLAKFKTPDTYYLYNHVDIVIEYHPLSDKDWGQTHEGVGGRIVAAKIYPRSIKHQKEGAYACSAQAPVLGIPGAKLEKELKIKYTYSVIWKKNLNVKWTSRWDFILEFNTSTIITWFNTIISPVFILLLGLGIVVMMRGMYKDIACFNKVGSLGCISALVKEDVYEEIGWILVHGDVFRPPRKGMLLSVFVGNGVQLFFMTLITLGIASLGVLSPANRGALTTCALALYVCFGAPAGYVSSRIYKMNGGEKWKSNAGWTALLVQGVVFSIFFILNLVLWTKGSSAAVPYTTLIALLALWFGISVPLTFIGAYFGFRKKAIEFPLHINEVPRQIPFKRVCTHPLTGVILGGLLPFLCIFVQLFFILTSIWLQQLYYTFGYLLLNFIFFVIMCCEVTVLMCYYHLSKEDYRWWWRSFLASGSVTIYVFFYCVHFFSTKLEMSGFTNCFLYFGYTAIIVFLLFILTGTIGFFACFWLVSKFYSIIKVEQLDDF